jgi:hypothetical protein
MDFFMLGDGSLFYTHSNYGWLIYFVYNIFFKGVKPLFLNDYFYATVLYSA